MRQLIPLKILLLAGMLCTTGAGAAEISGAGATFPATLYKQWGKSYGEATGVVLKYQGTGSGDGIKQIEAKAVDFGASDMPLHADKLKEAGLFQFPTVVGGVVVVISVAGVPSGALKLDGPTLANIFMGKITKWNAPAIGLLNPGISLPNADINVVHRSDSSGTTFIFSHYLSSISPEWKATMGEGTTVPWKVGKGCRTNLLIPICIYQLDNSIGYMDYAFAARNDMNFVQLKNHDGRFVAPRPPAFEAAAAYAQWTPSSTGFYEILTDKPGADTWPITGATFIVMHAVQNKPEAGREALKFFGWAYTQGDATALELGYVPLPDAVHQRVRAAWDEHIKDAGGKPLCPEGCPAAGNK